MGELHAIRSVSFDTSFLLKESSLIDKAIKTLARDRIPCFLTSTVVSEIEQLKVWGRISPDVHKQAMKRWANAHATVIDFKNQLFSTAFGKICMQSMQRYHGAAPEHIANDCRILVSALKNGVDLFLSEDFHFTSQVTTEVIAEVQHKACSEYHQMCDTMLFSIDVTTFLTAYNRGSIDLDVVRSNMKLVRKK